MPPSNIVKLSAQDKQKLKEEYLQGNEYFYADPKLLDFKEHIGRFFKESSPSKQDFAEAIEQEPSSEEVKSTSCKLKKSSRQR